MLTKVTKHSKDKLQAKKQTWVQFVFVVPWIIRNKTLPPIAGCLPYTFLSYCNGLLKILQRVQICSVRCTSEPRAKKLSASGGYTDWYTGRWWVGYYILYNDEGTGRGRRPPRSLIAVRNVTAHLSTASVPISVPPWSWKLFSSRLGRATDRANLYPL